MPRIQRPRRTSRINLEGQPEPLKLYMQDLASKWMDRCLPAHYQPLKQFYRWLAETGHQVESLTPEGLVAYQRVIQERPMTPSSRQSIFKAITRHLGWLHERGLCGMEPSSIPGPAPKRECQPLAVSLPQIALNFLATLPSHKRPGTCESYLNTLRHLYSCIAEAGLDIRAFAAKEFGIFLEYLDRRQINAAGRHGHVALARVYLRWLYDQNLIDEDPDRAARKIKLPKIPDVLPRPLPPEVDKLFEEAFAAGEAQEIRGLYVMRHTGIRIGELTNLAFDCIREDQHGHSFIKVPLGKLHNERLVPITAKTIDMIKKIQLSTLARIPGGSSPQHLFLDKRGRRLRKAIFHSAFRDVKQRLITEGKLTESPQEFIVPHRLRHTYATEMLTGGMSLVAVKELLGHRALRMTLRYAKVVPTKVIEEYFAAIKSLAEEQGFEPTSETGATLMLGYRKLLADLVFMLKKRADGATPASAHKIRHLVIKAEQLGRDIGRL